MHIIDKDRLYEVLLVRRQLEFSFNGKNYTLIMDSEGAKSSFTLGRVYDIPEKFAEWGELTNHAKIENHFFREMIPTLDFQ